MGYFLSTPADSRNEVELVRCLASECRTASRAAADALWEFWLNEAGPAARAEIDRGIQAMRDGELAAAAAIFTSVMSQHPTWPEAMNKLATVRYLQGDPEGSIALGCETVKLKPDHFGAWNGLTLCAIQTGDWLLAREAVLQSLRLQPGSASNQQILALIDSRLVEC